MGGTCHGLATHPISTYTISFDYDTHPNISTITYTLIPANTLTIPHTSTPYTHPVHLNSLLPPTIQIFNYTKETHH